MYEWKSCIEMFSGCLDHGKFFLLTSRFVWKLLNRKFDLHIRLNFWEKSKIIATLSPQTIEYYRQPFHPWKSIDSSFSWTVCHWSVECWILIDNRHECWAGLTRLLSNINYILDSAHWWSDIHYSDSRQQVFRSISVYFTPNQGGVEY